MSIHEVINWQFCICHGITSLLLLAKQKHNIPLQDKAASVEADQEWNVQFLQVPLHLLSLHLARDCVTLLCSVICLSPWYSCPCFTFPSQRARLSWILMTLGESSFTSIQLRQNTLSWPWKAVRSDYVILEDSQQLLQTGLLQIDEWHCDTLANKFLQHSCLAAGSSHIGSNPPALLYQCLCKKLGAT